MFSRKSIGEECDFNYESKLKLTEVIAKRNYEIFSKLSPGTASLNQVREAPGGFCKFYQWKPPPLTKDLEPTPGYDEIVRLRNELEFLK